MDPQTYKPLYEDEPDYTTVSSNNSITTKMKNKENSKNFSKPVNHPAKTSSHFKASSSSNVPSATPSSASGSKWKSFVGGFKGNGRTHIDHGSVDGEKIVYPKSASITTAPAGETKSMKRFSLFLINSLIFSCETKKLYRRNEAFIIIIFR